MYHIGQKVVCVKGATDLDGIKLKEGKVYTIKGVTACKCRRLLNVGIQTQRHTRCERCTTRVGRHGEWWLKSERFAPLEEYLNHNKAVEQLFKEFDLQTI